MAELTGPDLGALMRELKEVDAKMATALRRNIRNAAKVAAKDVQAEVVKPAPRGTRGSGITRTVRKSGSYVLEEDGQSVRERYTYETTEKTSVRQEIARGIGVKIATGKRGASVSIVGSSKFLPGNRKPMLRLYNKESWRHPVFAKSAWVTQQGRPYFAPVLTKHTDDVRRAIVAAVDEANAALLRAK